MRAWKSNSNSNSNSNSKLQFRGPLSGKFVESAGILRLVAARFARVHCAQDDNAKQKQTQRQDQKPRAGRPRHMARSSSLSRSLPGLGGAASCRRACHIMVG